MVSIYNKILVFSNRLFWVLILLLVFYAWLDVNTSFIFILLILCQFAPMIYYSWMRSKTELLFDISFLDSEISQEVYFYDSYGQIEVEIGFTFCGFFKPFQVYDLFEVQLVKDQDEKKITIIPSNRVSRSGRRIHHTNLSFKNVKSGTYMLFIDKKYPEQCIQFRRLRIFRYK